jgi:hypothetical protein
MMHKRSIIGVDVVFPSDAKLSSCATAGKAIIEFEVPRLHDSVANPKSRLFVAMTQLNGQKSRE